MNIDDLFLRKEELPILTTNYYNHFRFCVPVHPAFLRPDISLDENLPHTVFLQAAQEWYHDLQEILPLIPDEETRQWYENVFLREQPDVEKHYGRLRLRNGTWESQVFPTETGFCGLSISRNAGGSLTPPEKGFLGYRLVRFTTEKFAAYAHPDFPKVQMDSEGRPLCVLGYHYGHHNIDYYPSALFLRNWGILYLNAALKSLVEQGKISYVSREET
ncbi:MAG: hypothetical protein AABX37_01645 [Nanoarchaeota archaeon]